MIIHLKIVANLYYTRLRKHSIRHESQLHSSQITFPFHRPDFIYQNAIENMLIQ